MILDKFRVQARIHVYKKTEVDEDTEQPFTHWALLIDYFVPGNLELVEKSELYDLMDDGEGYQKVIHRSFSRFWDMSEQDAELITLYDGEHRWVENKWNSVEDFGKMYTEMKHWYNSVTEDTALFVAELLHHLNIVQCMPPLSAQKGVISNADVLSRTYFSHLVFKNMKTYIMGNKGFYLRIAKTLMNECERGFTQMFQELGEDFLAQLSKTIADEIANRLVAEEIDFLTPMYLLRIASTTIASTLSRFSVGAAISAEISGIPAEVDQNAGNVKKGKPKTKKQNKVHKFGSNFMDTKGKEGQHKPAGQEDKANNMEEQEEEEIPAEVDIEDFKKDKLKTKKKNKVQKFGAGFMEKKGEKGQPEQAEEQEEVAPEEQEEPAEVEVEGKPKTKKKNKVQKFGAGFMEKKVKDGQPEQAEEQEEEAEAPEEQEVPVEDIKKDKPKTKKQNKVQKFGAGFMEKKGEKGQPEQPVEQEEEAPEEEPTEVEVEDVKKDKPKTKKQNKVQKFGAGFMEKKGKEGQPKFVEQEEAAEELEAPEEQEEPAEVEVENVKKDKPKTKKQNKVQKFGSGFMEKKGVKEEQQEPVEQDEEAPKKEPEAQKKQPSMKEKLIAQRKQEKEAAEEAERAERAEKAKKAEEAAMAEKMKLAEKLEGEEENRFPTQAQLSKFAQVTSSVRFHDDDLIQMSTEVFAVLTKMLLDKKYGTEFTGKFNDEELKTLVEGVLPWFDTAAKLGIPWVTYVKEMWNPFSIRY